MLFEAAVWFSLFVLCRCWRGKFIGRGKRLSYRPTSMVRSFDGPSQMSLQASFTSIGMLSSLAKTLADPPGEMARGISDPMRPLMTSMIVPARSGPH